MDNENLEITNLEAQTAGRQPWGVDTTVLTKQVLPVAGGVVAAAGIGYLLYRFVIKPSIAKYKANKAAKVEAAPVVEEKGEES